MCMTKARIKGTSVTQRRTGPRATSPRTLLTLATNVPTVRLLCSPALLNWSLRSLAVTPAQTSPSRPAPRRHHANAAQVWSEVMSDWKKTSPRFWVCARTHFPGFSTGRERDTGRVDGIRATRFHHDKTCILSNCVLLPISYFYTGSATQDF